MFKKIRYFITLLLICVCFCYGIFKTISYLNFNVVTKFERIRDSNADFVSISFCSNNFSNKNNTFNIIESKINLKNNCSKYFDRFYNNCYTFNYKNSIKISKPGIQNGLFLKLLLPEINNLEIIIHNYTRTNLDNIEKIIITPGETLITISREFIEEMNRYNDNCYDDNKNKYSYINDIYENNTKLKYCKRLEYFNSVTHLNSNKQEYIYTFKIFYKKFDYLLVKQYLIYDFLDLLSSISAILGLCFGFNLLKIINFFE